MKIALKLEKGISLQGAQDILDEIKDKMSSDYDEILSYKVEEEYDDPEKLRKDTEFRRNQVK